MQAVVSVEEKLIVIPKEIIRRRMRLQDTMRSSTSRCLFGVPDPVETSKFATEIMLANQREFEETWNFKVGKDFGPGPKKHGAYFWEEIIEADQMARANMHRFEVPCAPNTRPVTLFFAPSEDIKVEPMQNLKRNAEESQLDESDGSNAMGIPLDNGPQESNKSQSGCQNGSSGGHCARRQVGQSQPVLRQSSITDYMPALRKQAGPIVKRGR